MCGPDVPRPRSEIAFLTPPHAALQPQDHNRYCSDGWNNVFIAFIALDTWYNRKLNKVFLFAGIFLVAAMWVRLPLMSTGGWLSFAQWLVS